MSSALGESSVERGLLRHEHCSIHSVNDKQDTISTLPLSNPWKESLVPFTLRVPIPITSPGYQQDEAANETLHSLDVPATEVLHSHSGSIKFTLSGIVATPCKSCH